MAGKLSTHVLDTYKGRPASAVAWSLEYLQAGAWMHLSGGVTNQDGRTDDPLLLGDALRTGSYRLIFEIGAYFEAEAVVLPEPPFLGQVVLQVNLLAGEQYHVPLLTSPWSYSTYRGS
jgi:hydroxyisourate hydrolase